MKALMCNEFGMPETLVLEEKENLKASPGKIVISVNSCSVNFPDTLIIRNLYQFKPELPFSPGGEVAGIVKEIGEGVKHLKVGDRVFALCGWGGMAEEVAVDANRAFPMVPGMNFTTGASVMYNYGTSYHALKDKGQVKEGDIVLVLGAAGGVGLAAVEIAKLMGATVIAAASSDEKLAVCKQKGADFLINYSSENLKDKVKEYTNGHGADVIYDPVGDKYAEMALRAIAYKGRYLVVGFAAGEIPKIPLNLALLKSCAISGVFWGQFAEKEASQNFKNIQELAGYFMKGKLKPHIYKIYSLGEAASAISDMMNRKVIGKAVIEVKAEEKNAIPIAKIIPAEAPKAAEKGYQMEGSKYVFADLKELATFKGKSFATSDWHFVDQAMIDGFAESTKDFQWIHVDAERAKAESPFGGTIAHGFSILALSPNFLYKMFTVNSATISLNYGCNKVRFIAPTPVNSKVRMLATLKEVDLSTPGRSRIEIETVFEIEGQEKPVCVAELVSMVFE